MTRTTKQILAGMACIAAAGALFVSCTQSSKLPQNPDTWDDSSRANSDQFDLTNWKITLPIPDKKGKALEEKKLKGYESQYFYDQNGAMVFWAPVEGSTTKNSKYPRSELREREDGKDAKWNLARGGTMTATLRIDQVPQDKDGDPGKLVIGQIHGEDDELIRLYWDNGTVYFKNDISGKDGKEHLFRLRDAAGNTPRVSMGETFAYKIDARGDQLAVTIYADGQEYHSVTAINPVWQKDTLYFKAGVYLGVNANQGATGAAKVSFYGLDFSHEPGGGLGGIQQPK